MVSSRCIVLHPAESLHVLTVQPLTLLCSRVSSDKPRCLLLYLFHNHFFSHMALWPMLHLPYNVPSCLSSDCACWLRRFHLHPAETVTAALAIKSLDCCQSHFTFYLRTFKSFELVWIGFSPLPIQSHTRKAFTSESAV